MSALARRALLYFTALMVALTLALALVGCGTHASGPDPSGPNVAPGRAVRTIQFPYGFRNVTLECLGKNGVYVTSAGQSDNLPSGVFVVVNDPECGG